MLPDRLLRGPFDRVSLGAWSSDGRIGARRLPAQQLEALACLLTGAGALATFLELGREPGGAIFAGAMAVYIAARQGLLALCAEPRRWSLAGPVTLAAAVAALAANIAVAALRCPLRRAAQSPKVFRCMLVATPAAG